MGHVHLADHKPLPCLLRKEWPQARLPSTGARQETSVKFVMPPRGSRIYNRYHEHKRYKDGWAREYGCWFCDNQADEWAWIHDADPADFDSYIALCYRCHQKYDNRWNEDERRKVSESLRDYWNSEEGMARREAMRGKGRAYGERTAEQKRHISLGKRGIDWRNTPVKEVMPE